MAIYRYLVTVEMLEGENLVTASQQDMADEIDSNLESCVLSHGIEHFTVEAIEYVERDSYRERVIRSIEQ